VTGRGKWGKVQHSEGKGGEWAVEILRFQDGSPHLCRLRTTSVEPDGQALICTAHMSSFMGPGKPSSLVTTLLNRTSLLRGGLLEGEWGSPGWRVGWTITGSQDFVLGVGVWFQLSREFADVYRTWDSRGHTYDVLVRFFPYSVYTDLNHHDTPRYEWPLACCCPLVVCLVVFRWIVQRMVIFMIIMVKTVLIL
jgi:hypothetical protein